MRIPDTVGFLLGEWTLLRWLRDQRSGARGRFTGTASVSATAAGQACYRETGQLRFAGHVGPASRILHLHGRPDGSAELTFADGRPYLTVDLRGGDWAGDHPCREDTYRIGFRVPSPALVVERWQVRGPAKHYDALTLLRRVGRPDTQPTSPVAGGAGTGRTPAACRRARSR